jgi:hypothetical protein
MSPASNTPAPPPVVLPPGIVKALRVFKAHFPELLKKYPRQWAACDTTRFLFVGESWDAIYKRCVKRGLKEDEFVVCCLLPDATEYID